MKLKSSVGLLSFFAFLLLFSCTKINEATTLGGELIPAVDNVNTFDTTLEVQAAYFPFADTSKSLLSDPMALGQINDPVFGTTAADMYFTLNSLVYGSSPFRDTVLQIDSVVLSLAYRGAYGDTNTAVTVSVSEINPNNGFVDTVLYRFDTPGFSTGGTLGTKTFMPSQLDDVTTVIRGRDTARLVNVIRIPLNNSIGEKLRNFDTSATGGFRNDSLFRRLFRGLAVKTTSVAGAGALSYINLTDANTSLLVYYQSRRNGVRDTTVARFVHATYGQANAIRRTPASEFTARLGNSASQKLYVQSSPSGSYVGIFVPDLSNFPNKVIHRAELIAYRVPSDNPSLENLFTPPSRLFLDRKQVNGSDSSYLFENDLQPGFDGSLNFAAFGGQLRTDDSYRFNLTRHVQGIVTRREPNDSLRLYAPLRTVLVARNIGQIISVPVIDAISRGRVVIANNNYSNRDQRLRLRVIYSNL